jgi:hypothetical protein
MSPLLLFPADAIDIHQVQLIEIGDGFEGFRGRIPLAVPRDAICDPD